LFLNLQWIHYLTFDAPSARLDSSREFVSLLLRFDFRGETLLPQLFVLVGLDEGETMIARRSVAGQRPAGADRGRRPLHRPARGPARPVRAAAQCQPVPAGLPVPGAGGCLFDAPPGRTSRVFLRVRYSFGWRH
jgi:hypothetical protein